VNSWKISCISCALEQRTPAEEAMSLFGIEDEHDLPEVQRNFTELLAILREWDERDREQEVRVTEHAEGQPTGRSEP